MIDRQKENSAAYNTEISMNITCKKHQIMQISQLQEKILMNY